MEFEVFNEIDKKTIEIKKSGEKPLNMVLHFMDKEIKFEISHNKPGNVSLKEIHKQLDGYILKTCFSCKHLMFSGMSHDMSSGTKGYCNKQIEEKKEKGEKWGYDTLTTIYDLCDKYTCNFSMFEK